MATTLQTNSPSALEHAPRYRGQFDKVWLWKDWPERWGTDAGIDLVARTRTGELWAIPSKADHPNRAIPKREIDSFLSESSRPEFAYRLLMATTDEIGATARRTLHAQEKPLGLVLRGHVLTEELEWPVQIGGTAAPLARWNPRPHQATAIQAVINGFSVRRGSPDPAETPDRRSPLSAVVNGFSVRRGSPDPAETPDRRSHLSAAQDGLMRSGDLRSDRGAGSGDPRTTDRGRLIMACGTGKTLTALWIAERLQSSLTLVLVPSLSLVQQNLAEWGRHAAQGQPVRGQALGLK